MGFELNSNPTFYFFPLLALCFLLCVAALFFTLLFALLLSFSSCCSPLHIVVFLFMLLFSFSHCCFPFRAITFLFALLFYFSPYCSPFCTTLLFSFLHQVATFFFGCSFILGTRFFVLLLSSS